MSKVSGNWGLHVLKALNQRLCIYVKVKFKINSWKLCAVFLAGGFIIPGIKAEYVNPLSGMNFSPKAAAPARQQKCNPKGIPMIVTQKQTDSQMQRHNSQPRKTIHRMFPTRPQTPKRPTSTSLPRVRTRLF